MGNNQYSKFFGMLFVSFAVMYGIMFLNVDQTDHIYLSLTRFYMTLLMVSPMALIMLIFMPGMYQNKKWNTLIYAGSILVFVLSFAGLKNQTFIGDKQYLRAMIPHHSSAIMTSKAANLKDPEVKKLAEGIIKSQREEIEQMKFILGRNEK